MGRNKEMLPAPDDNYSISVQRLNKAQAESMGIDGLFKDVTCQAVAIKRGEDGQIIQARIILGVDLQRFVFGDEEYLRKVLVEAKRALFSD
jgi:hypothetical protein